MSGDTYKGGIVQKKGEINIETANITQIWHELKDTTDLPALAQQLATLRSEMRKTATTPEDDKAVAMIGEAQEAAEQGKGEAVVEKLTALQKLKKAGRWALEVGEKIGVGLAVAMLKSVIMPDHP